MFSITSINTSSSFTLRYTVLAKAGFRKCGAINCNPHLCNKAKSSFILGNKSFLTFSTLPMFILVKIILRKYIYLMTRFGLIKIVFYLYNIFV